MWKAIPAWVARLGLTALLVTSVLAWLRFAPPEAPWSPQSILAAVLPKPKVIEKIKYVDVPGPERIRIIPKEKIKVIYKDLPTPPTLADNNAWVTAVCDVPPSPGGGTAISVITTGKDNVAVGTIEYQQKKMPFFQVKREMGIRGGYGTEGVIGEMYVHPLRLGPADLEGRVYGRAGNGDSEVGAAILFDMRF